MRLVRPGLLLNIDVLGLDLIDTGVAVIATGHDAFVRCDLYRLS